MVESMLSRVSKDLPAEAARPSNLPDFPIFEEAPREHWPLAMSWAEAARCFAPLRDHYMANHDSAEARLADKNPEPFVLD